VIDDEKTLEESSASKDSASSNTGTSHIDVTLTTVSY